MGLYDATMIVMGAMIGSGIFIVSADMARLINSPGWLLAAWVLTGVLTIAAALCFGELAAMLPHAGGVYVFLREAYSPLWGFLYGWTVFTVIQTGTIAAVAVAFARFFSLLVPAGVGEPLPDRTPAPFARLRDLAFHRAADRDRGHPAADLVQFARPALRQDRAEHFHLDQGRGAGRAGAGRAAARLECAGGAHQFLPSFHAGRVSIQRWASPAGSAFGLMIAICVSQSGSLFAATAWSDVTFIAAEVRDPHRNLPRAMAIGCGAVIGLYVLANVAYLAVLPLPGDSTRALGPRGHGGARKDLSRLRPGADGDRDHDLDLRMHQRADPGRRARVLCDGQGRTVLRARGRAESRPGSGMVAGGAGRLGVRCWCCRGRSIRPRANTGTCTAICSIT